MFVSMKLSVSLQDSNHDQNFLFAVIIIVIILVIVSICLLIWWYVKDQCVYPFNLRRKSEYSPLLNEKIENKTESKYVQKPRGPKKSLSSFNKEYIPDTPVVIEPKSYKKPSGLKNNSSECYMNSIIQAVASSDKLIEQFKNIQSNYPYLQSLNNFVELLQNVNKSDDSYQHLCKNTDLLENMIRSINWTKPSQQDAFDLLSALINGIHRDIKSINLENFEMPMKLKMVYRFKGIKIPNKFQYHLGLSVGLTGEYSTKPGVTLNYLIDQYFQPTIIDDDPNKTSQICPYRVAPDVLLIHIQANKWDNKKGEMIKPEYYIKYDQEMKLNLNIVNDLDKDEIKPENVNYKIKSVVQHMGDIGGGHYVTYRNWNNQWFLVNDEQVESIEFNSDICPYIMIYEKC